MAKKEGVNGKSKKERLLEKLKDEIKLAEKNNELLKVGKLSDFQYVSRDSYVITGVLGYDLNINGLKKGTFSIIYGDESTGKTTLCLSLIEGVQMVEPDAITLYIDAEQSIDEKFLSRMPYLNTENIVFIKEAIAETVLDRAIEYISENLIDYVIIDSIDAMLSLTSLEKDLDKALMMDKARILSRALPKFTKFCSENNVSMIFIQQVRNVTKGQFVVSGKSGGKAMDYYNAATLKISNINAKNEISKKNGQIVTKFMNLKNEKNKIGEPYKNTYTYINTSNESKTSIDRIRECFEYATEYGIIDLGGSWYSIPDANGEIVKVQGSDKAVQIFRKDIDLYSITKLRVYGLALDPEIFIVKFDDILKLLKTENKKMKEQKINALTVMGLTDLIDKKDYEEWNIGKVTAKDFMEESKYEKAKFDMLPFEEKEKLIEEKKAKLKK